MHLYIYHIFKNLRPAFSREVPWILCCSVILGMIGCSEMAGISSLCRFWGLNERGYLSLLNFFRSSSWNHQTLMKYWSQFVLKQNLALKEKGRLVILGDHVLSPKDGRHMPGVVSLHQTSETQSKPGFFRGHCWGVIALAVGSMKHCFALPLQAQIDQGFVHLDQEPTDTLSQRPVRMTLNWALAHQQKVILILDAFFCLDPVFDLANSIKDEENQPIVEIITKAKKNYVGYESHDLSKEAGIKLDEDFEKADSKRGWCQIYGQMEEVSYRVRNLCWGPQKRMIRFVWVESSLGRMMLMCSNLELDPLKAVELYCKRMRIEMAFDRLKNVLKAFACHFWSKGLPRHSRKPKKNTELQAPESKADLTLVKQTWQAYERFLALGCIALGMLQLLSLKYPQPIKDRFQSFMRTPGGFFPSERVVKEVLALELKQHMGKVSAGATLMKIQAYHVKSGFLWQPKVSESEFLCDTT